MVDRDTEGQGGMERVISKDGTLIAYDRMGEGPSVVLLGGAFNDRFTATDLATALSDEFAVYAYDRRGRGDSGDTPPYAVQREIDDLDAIIEAAGGTAFVYGVSSGAVLALRAAIAGSPIVRLALFEPPFRGRAAPPEPPGYRERVTELTASGRRAEAVEYFMTEVVGLPREAVTQMRMSPAFAELEAMSPTLVYDAMVMGDNTMPIGQLAGFTLPTLVINSSGSPPWLRDAALATSSAIVGARHLELSGEFHQVPAGVLEPVLAEFFLGAI
jgi:pimeloyl-ACP methyl ester carboxylesterase